MSKLTDEFYYAAIARAEKAEAERDIYLAVLQGMEWNIAELNDKETAALAGRLWKGSVKVYKGLYDETKAELARYKEALAYAYTCACTGSVAGPQYIREILAAGPAPDSD